MDKDERLKKELGILGILTSMHLFGNDEQQKAAEKLAEKINHEKREL